MGSKVTGVKIKGIGKYVPEMVATNEDFTKIVETSDEWITQRTGIKQRHITNGEPTYYLGAMAAKAAMADDRQAVIIPNIRALSFMLFSLIFSFSFIIHSSVFVLSVSFECADTTALSVSFQSLP